MKRGRQGIHSILFTVGLVSLSFSQWYLPANYSTCDIDSVRLTKIGSFGMVRKARPSVPRHYHTGIDIMRPGTNYINEPVFPARSGTIISSRTDGPFSQIIIEHKIDSALYWTVYEHVHVVRGGVGCRVTPFDTIAYFFNTEELNRYGWQFDHVHFEINRVKPVPVAPTKELPDRHFITYGITCYSKKELFKRLENPIEFLRNRIYGR